MTGEAWETAPSCWTFNQDGSVTSTNTGFTANFLMTQTDDTYGNYSVEATFRGTNSTELTQEVNMGIIPWYLNAGNYVLTYLKWNPGNFRLINVQTICFIDGVLQGWNDHWLDFPYADTLYTLKNTDAITMKVSKAYNQATSQDTYSVTVSGTNEAGKTMSETPAVIDFGISVPYAAIGSKVGLYTMNDTVTVSNFKTEKTAQAGSYQKIAGTESAGVSSTANGWTYANNQYTVDATLGGSGQNQAILPNEFAKGSYQVSYHASVGEGQQKELSILPYYANENNFVRFVLKEGEGVTIHAEGKIAGGAFMGEAQAVTGTIDWTSVDFAAAKNGTQFTAFVNGTEVGSYSNESLLDGALVGIGAGKASATFSDVKVITLEYIPYDWFSSNGYYVSAMTKDGVEFSENTISLKSVEGEERYTRVYRASEKYNRVVVDGKFVGDSENVQYGLYANYTSETQYAFVEVANGSITLSAVNGEESITESVALPANTLLAAEHTLTVEAVYGKITVWFDGTQVLEKNVGWLEGVETGNVGCAALGGVVTCEFAVDGFVPYVSYTEGDWTFRGARLSSWTTTESGVSATTDGGFRFKETTAIKANPYSPAEGYFFGAEININQLSGNEWKTGIMPYYVDGANHVFVWLSQWSGNATTICITAVLNGTVVGSEWRETPVAYTMQGEINYLEVEVEGDSVRVYLNKSFSPTVATQIDGLSACAKASVGFNAFNTGAEFANVTLSQTRQQKETGKPTIEAIGNIPTTGKVDSAIKLPVWSATGVGGTTANVTITVTDPDNGEVTLDKNSFTPTKEGTYKVRVVAQDAWGNQAEEEYTITVEAATPDPGVPGGEQPEKKGCGSAIGGGTAGLSLALIAGAAIVAAIRKKKD